MKIEIDVDLQPGEMIAFVHEPAHAERSPELTVRAMSEVVDKSANAAIKIAFEAGVLTEEEAIAKKYRASRSLSCSRTVVAHGGQFDVTLSVEHCLNEIRDARSSTRPILMHPDDAAKLFERQDGDANRGTLSIDLGTGSGQRRRR